ncbi:MAG: cadmium-translocating P-type ATPase [Rhodospirillaceae bacterium]|nr:cadmium-translocating P-type ATPase [Rhodospirillaceae bacterium]
MSATAQQPAYTLGAETALNMGCCPPGQLASGVGRLPAGPLSIPNADPSSYVRRKADGTFELFLIVENMTCPACVPDIENTLSKLAGITQARVNLTLGRLHVTWRDADFPAELIASTLSRSGYRAIAYDAAMLDRLEDHRDRRLLRALAVAGFASANIMLLSVSIWSGNVTDMGTATRDFFHWISALIALPAIAYAGQPFFMSAWEALRGGRVNMDVPISLGVLLATLASVMESIRSGTHAYFDAAVMLLFFLLIGRYLEQNMRGRTRSVAANLLALKAVAATVLEPTGERRSCPAEQLRPGMTVFVAPGDRIPADGIVTQGSSDIDASLVTGESLPVAATINTPVYAGTLPLTGALEISVTSTDQDTLLGQIVELMNTSASAKSSHALLADRAARYYAPAVHILAAGTFLGWLLLGSGGWHPALMSAVAVLIITCPCALGLAIPAVQAVAMGALLRSGVLLKSGDGLERLANVDAVVFDKTGTLTLGRPELIAGTGYTDADLMLAARLAQSTRHPLAAALTRAVPALPHAVPVHETAGYGVSAVIDGQVVKLGSRLWCEVPDTTAADSDTSELWLRKHGYAPVRFSFRDQPRADAPLVIAALKKLGMRVEVLSGDRIAAVTPLARMLALDAMTAEARPDTKLTHLQALHDQGQKVLMVGDGLNDAPALAAAYVSMSPSSAADISQTAADIVFRGENLWPVIQTIRIARASKQRMIENIALAIIYNIFAVPMAMAGWVTPLIAAVAMSGSSIIVVVNALRLGWGKQEAAP